MTSSPLIDAAALAARLHDPAWVVIDCRFTLTEPATGRAAYDRGHVPGARYAHLDDDLASVPTAGQGRHPLPDPAVLAARLGAWGIDNDCNVVAYDEGSGAVAARLWWLLRWLGHRAGFVLDGGFGAWQAQQLPIETAAPAWTARRFVLRGTADTVVTTEALPALQERGALVVDVRTATRYRGEQEPIDPVAGHVPGARNWPFSNALTPEGRFRAADELRRDLRALLGDRDARDVIAMCGSGVTACHLLLALDVAGLDGARLYAGSWSEWIRDPARAIRAGAEP